MLAREMFCWTLPRVGENWRVAMRIFGGGGVLGGEGGGGKRGRLWV